MLRMHFPIILDPTSYVALLRNPISVLQFHFLFSLRPLRNRCDRCARLPAGRFKFRVLFCYRIFIHCKMFFLEIFYKYMFILQSYQMIAQ